MELQHKTILITGGASGLGAACVRTFHAAGARTVIADLNAEAGKALALELGEGCLFLETNVTSEESVVNTFQKTLEQYSNLHGVINCAGIGHAERLTGKRGIHSLENFQRVLSINLVGTFNVVRLAAQTMSINDATTEGERGVIINTASIAAFDGQIGQAAYSASKGGIAAMTLPLARELARSGIRVVAIAPGIFDTPLMAGLPAAARTSLEQQVPFPARLGQPYEYAALARHIFENVMLNGEVIRLDGALRMGSK